MKITAIQFDANGYRLISFHEEIYRPKYKPLRGITYLADYKDNLLRIFVGSTSHLVRVPDFKHAIKYIFSL